MCEKYILGSWPNNKLGLLSKLIEYPFRYLSDGVKSKPYAVAGWGFKRSGILASEIAFRFGVKLLRLEDGFIRSFHPGQNFPSLSLVVDDVGIFYDSSAASVLEDLIIHRTGISDVDIENLLACKKFMIDESISKYNHAINSSYDFFSCNNSGCVLVVDQTYGDMSVLKGSADASTFRIMLQSALDENPDSTIYV